MKTKVKSRNGISLIVLVITIIVMIVLAGAIILALNNSGIIGKANKAKINTEYASAKEIVATARAEWALYEENKVSGEVVSFKEYSETKLKENGYKVNEGTGSYEVTEDGDVYIYPIIPDGFVASTYEGENTVIEGLVIYETSTLSGVEKEVAQKTYNQFVWVPVPEISEFVREDGYYEGDKQTLVTTNSSVEPCTTLAALSVSNDVTGEFAEYAAMKESVEKYGGFYIGRYEVGSTTKRVDTDNGTTEFEIKKEMYPYNYASWGPSMILANGDVMSYGKNQGKGAVELSRSMYRENNSMVSTLCYGVEWDAALKFIAKVEPSYLIKDEGKGWYYDTVDANKEHITGKDIIKDGVIVNKICNIYDMAGNVAEWTMEANSKTNRVMRGGCYVDNGNRYPSSYRYTFSPSLTNEARGFRVALYLK